MTQTLLPVIPADVTITVLDESTVAGMKRSLDVELSRRVSEFDLRAIAEHLKNRNPAHYDRTFIVYYLPGMRVDAGGWATTHFEPDLVIRILGTTIEQEDAMASASLVPTRSEIIGTWANDQPFMASRITLYRDAGKTFILPEYSDGSGSPAEVLESQTGRGRRFHERGSADDYFLLTPSGALEIRDSEGLIATLRPTR